MAARPLDMGFNHLQKTPAYMTIKDRYLQMHYTLRHACVQACKHGCHSCSRKGKSDVIYSSACVSVTGDTWRCVNSSQSGPVGCFKVPLERKIEYNQIDYKVRHTCKPLQDICNQIIVKDFKEGSVKMWRIPGVGNNTSASPSEAVLLSWNHEAILICLCTAAAFECQENHPASNIY